MGLAHLRTQFTVSVGLQLTSQGSGRRTPTKPHFNAFEAVERTTAQNSSERACPVNEESGALSPG